MGNIDLDLSKERQFVFQVSDNYLDSLNEQTYVTAEMIWSLIRVDLTGKRVESLEGKYPGLFNSFRGIIEGYLVKIP